MAINIVGRGNSLAAKKKTLNIIGRITCKFLSKLREETFNKVIVLSETLFPHQ